MRHWVACGNSWGFEGGKRTRLKAPSGGSCRDEPPQAAAACGPVDAGPRNAAAAADVAAAVIAAAVVVVVSADVNGVADAGAAVVPFLGLCERQV